MDNLRIAIVGCGYWGQNLLRNFSEVEGSAVAAVCDGDAQALRRAQRRAPTARCYRDFEEVIRDPQVDAVALATPVSTHYPFARQAILAGKHVMVEKPIATTTDEVIELVELAERHGRVLMVDHTFIYTGAVRKMKEVVSAGEMGELLYYDSVRVNLGLVQSDTNVLWDLGPHDFSIMDYLCDLEPVAVSAVGSKHLGCPYENMVYVTVQFDPASNMLAHFHLNWLAPVKVRRTLVGGAKKMIVYDDLEVDKVKIYDKGISIITDPEGRRKLLTSYRNGDMLAPTLDGTEALRGMAREFISSIQKSRTPLTDGRAGYRVVRLLEGAQQSLDHGGEVVRLGTSAFPRQGSRLVATSH